MRFRTSQQDEVLPRRLEGLLELGALIPEEVAEERDGNEGQRRYEHPAQWVLSGLFHVHQLLGRLTRLPSGAAGGVALRPFGYEHVFVSAATILHADLDAFFASVEQRDDARLRGRPVIVGGGVVLAASYEAKAFGVRTAMGLRQARALCPRAIVVPPRMSAYSDASTAVFEVFANTSPLVEGISIDEAFLEVGGLARLSGSPTEIAVRLRREVLDLVGLRISVGVARTKFLAKVASGVAKPDGLLVVAPDREREFLHPLPVDRLWGVGRKTAAKLNARGITTVGEVAALQERVLTSLLGPASGHHLHALAHNRDPRPVETGRRRRSIGSQHALGRTPKSAAAIDAVLVGLVDRVTHRMRAAHRVGRTVILRLRFDDFTRATRSRTLPQATARTETILTAARTLLATASSLVERHGITLIGVSVGNLDDDAAVQLELPYDRRTSGALDGALDQVIDRFGSRAVTRAVLLDRADRPAAPMLPD
jgi:DNA polymerase-4